MGALPVSSRSSQLSCMPIAFLTRTQRRLSPERYQPRERRVAASVWSSAPYHRIAAMEADGAYSEIIQVTSDDLSEFTCGKTRSMLTLVDQLRGRGLPVRVVSPPAHPLR